jgi:hypothetical protein
MRMDLREIGWEDVDWIYVAEDRNHSCEHRNEPSGSIKGRELLG